MNRVRLSLAAAGMAGALLAVTREDERIAWIAIAFLLLYLVVRVVQRKRDAAHPPDEPEE